MKFMVDEMPDSDECPFSNYKWDHERWVYFCSLTNAECNLYEKEGECYGLKEMKGPDHEKL